MEFCEPATHISIVNPKTQVGYLLVKKVKKRFSDGGIVKKKILEIVDEIVAE